MKTELQKLSPEFHAALIGVYKNSHLWELSSVDFSEELETQITQYGPDTIVSDLIDMATVE